MYLGDQGPSYRLHQNSDLLYIVAVDDKTGNIKMIHYLTNIESTQLQAAQINAAKTDPAGI